jgi:hypothetical protein
MATLYQACLASYAKISSPIGFKSTLSSSFSLTPFHSVPAIINILTDRKFRAPVHVHQRQYYSQQVGDPVTDWLLGQR